MTRVAAIRAIKAVARVARAGGSGRAGWYSLRTEQPVWGGGNGGGGDPFEQFRHFFGQMPHQFKQRGLGSGVIVSPDGYILTNNHVVGHADEIHVTLLDKREFTAKVIGKDPKTDLALIKIDTNQPLPSASLGDSGRDRSGRLGGGDRQLRSAST